MSRPPIAAGFILVVGFAAVCGCTPKRTTSPRPRADRQRLIARIGWLEIHLEDPPPEKLVGVLPDDLLAARDAMYRLLPDRRVLYAVAEIRRVVDGRQYGPILVGFENNGWRVRYGGEDVGRLSEIPSWSDAKTFLAAWTERIGRKKARPKPPDDSALEALRRPLAEGSAPEVVSALARLDEFWPKSALDPELLRLACGGLTWLHLQTHDRLERTDPLLGHALALLALAQRGGARDLPHEEALLAHELGYGAAAQEAAQVLPTDDPIRLFVGRDLSSLKALAESTRDRRIEYLTLLRLAQEGDPVAWAAFRSGTHWSGPETPPVLHAALALGDFSQTTSRAKALFHAAMEEAGVMSSQPAGSPPEARLSELEEALARRAESVKGPLFDGTSAISVTRANAYSGLYAIARFDLDTWYVAEAARSFVSTVTNAPAGTADELVRWVNDRVAVREGEPAGRQTALNDLARFREIGIGPLSTLRQALRNVAPTPVNPDLRRPIPGYFGGLDTRPAHLLEAGWVSWDNLVDLARGERYLRAAVKGAPAEAGRYLQWVALRDADEDELRRIADRRDVPGRTRASALQDLATLSSTSSVNRGFLESRYRELLEEDHEDTSTLDALVKLLEASGDFERADEAIRQFLVRRSNNTDLTWASVEAKRAGLLRRAGRLERAWAAVQPTLGTYKEDCLEEGARTLAASGDSRGAMRLARMALDRYPESAPAPALVAELLWRSGSHADAARTLAASEKTLSESDWQGEVTRAFVETFEKRPIDETVRAFDELRRAVPRPWRLGNIALKLGSRGGHEAAFRLLASLEGKDTEAMGLLVSAYGELAKVRGAKEGAAWLR